MWKGARYKFWAWLIVALFMLLVSKMSYAALTDIKFGQSQIADSQWNVSACLNTTTCQIYSKNPGTMYKIPWTSGQWNWQSGQYVQFSLSGNSSFPYEGKVYDSSGTQVGTIGTGKIVNMGPDYFFFVGNDNNTGQLFSGSSGMSGTSGVSWTGTLNPTIQQADTYANATYSTVPLSAGQTATTTPSTTTTTTTTTTAPRYITATNIGFESGNTNSWTISNNSGAANWNSGSGAAVVTGLQHTPGSGKSWTVTPYGNYMLSLQPGSGSPTFDSATASLGLTSAQNTAIKNLLIQQAQTSGGDPTPTNAAWVKRDLTLQAGVTYKIAWQYLSTDYAPFNDGSIITLVHKTDASKVPTLNNAVRNYALLGFTNLGTGDYSVDSYGATGWQIAIFTVPVDGDYSLGFAAFNLGDTALSPILLIDEQPGTTLLNGQTFTPINPNPGTGAPTPDGGGSNTPVYSSDITTEQTGILNAARTRLNAIGAVNRIDLYSDGSGNVVTIEQSGGYNRIQGIGGGDARVAGFGTSVNIKQGDTGRNLIELYVQGNGNDVTISQARNTTTGARTGSDSGGHYLQLNMTGDINTVVMRQGNDGGSSSGHFATLTVGGSSNNITIKQANNNEKQFFGSVNGNSNFMNVMQQGTGLHYLDLTLTGNGNSTSITQTGAGSHHATIALTNGGGASNLTLVQQGSTNQVYSIQQTCTNPAGCSVSVTQGN